MRTLKTVSFSLLCFLFCLRVFAAEEHEVEDGSTIQINISSSDLTRLAIKGEGRLNKIWGAAGIIEVQPDLDNGEVYIRPLPGAPPVISFLVSDIQGATYTVIARKKDIPTTTVFLKPKNNTLKDVENAPLRSMPLVEQVKLLIKGMANKDAVPGFYREFVERAVPLWRESTISLREVHTSRLVSGEVYVLENISVEDMVLHEREFFDFGQRVIAVAMDRMRIKPGERTRVFVVRRVGTVNG